MQDNLKLGVSLLILVSIFFLCVSLVLFFMKENEINKRTAIEANLEEIIQSKEDLSKDLDEINLTNRDLEAKLAGAEQKIAGLIADYSKEKEARELLLAELDKEKEEVKRLVSEVMGEKEERVSLVQKIAQAENEAERLKEQLRIILEAKESLEKKVKEIIAQRGVELEKIVVQTNSSIPTYPETEIPESPFSGFMEDELIREERNPEGKISDGEVLIVNKKFDFVIVNLGKSNGLDLGDSLEIQRHGKLIAEAQIEKLYNKMSAASILPQYKKVSIKVGDEIAIAR